MNHNIKKGDIVKCTTEKLCSFFRKDTMFEVYEVLGDDIFGREGYARHYTEVELVNPKPLIHQKWKDLHDKGVPLLWKRYGEAWYNVTSVSKVPVSFTEPKMEYRVRDHGYNYYKAQLDKIDLSFMVDKPIVIETYGLISLAQAFLDRGAECGACSLKNANQSKYSDIYELDKCFGLKRLCSRHATSSYYQEKGYTILSYQELLAHPDAQIILDSIDGVSCIAGTPKQIRPKEKPMNPLDLILLSIFQQEDQPKDATNANHLGILTEEDGSYVGYVYADSIEELDEVARKSENESRKLHIFSYDSTIAQKPRKIIKVERV